MKTENVTYLAMDVHASFCVLGRMDADGRYLGDRCLETREKDILAALRQMPRPSKLVLEEGAISRWICQLAKPLVDEVHLSDPRHNALISRSPRKSDSHDTEALCRLLRLGEIKSLWLPTNDLRCAYKTIASQYLDLTREQVRWKLRIKARFQGCGIMEVTGERIWDKSVRGKYLDRLPSALRPQVERLYLILDTMSEGHDSCRRDLLRQGHAFPEVDRFQAVPGVGPIVGNIFSALIQTPERFANKRKLLSYCGFAITDRSSAGKSLGRQRLDRNCCRPLKAASFAAYRGAMRAADDSVRRYHEAVLERTRNATHARLSTQRKIIATLYQIWKGNCAYDPERFIKPDPN